MLPSAFTILIAVIVCWSTLHHGLPALRHDWLLPADASALAHCLESFSQGWFGEGIGTAQPYPTFYLVATTLWPLHVAGGLVVAGTIIAITIALAAYGAAEFAGDDGDAGTRVALIAVATANPWVYNEIVAGHIFMAFGYAVILALTAEVLRRSPRLPMLVVLSAFAITQLEFFALVIIPFGCWCVRRRSWLPFAMIAVTALPIVIGIAASYGEIRATPYNLEWQQSQSVDLGSAALLTGYFANYASGFSAIGPAGIVLAIVAIFGIVRLRDLKERVVVGVGLVALVVASGTRGPVASLYQFIVLHVPESGLFRELYDLIGIVTIAYVLLLARALASHRALAYAAAVVSLALLYPWVATPASRWFVPEQTIPRVDAADDRPGRIALLPAFQPITYGGRGSGIDPDLRRLPDHVMAVNETFPTFPVVSALADTVATGDARALAGLGVDRIVDRPYLQSNAETLRDQGVAGAAIDRAAPSRLLDDAVPLFSAVSATTLVSIGNSPAEDAVFFGDADPRAILTVVRPDLTTTDPERGWIDARLTFVEYPEWGNAWGGASTNGATPLPVAEGEAILAGADGALSDDRGHIILAREPRLRWVRLNAGVRSVRCAGVCIVALSANLPPGLAEHGSAARHTPLPYARTFDWLYELSDVPAGPMRFNESYDRWWIAFADGNIAPHQRLDTALNLWLIPHPAKHVVVVHIVALVQATLEVIAMLTLALATVYAIGASAPSDALGT
jgi:hypothetical protein